MTDAEGNAPAWNRFFPSDAQCGTFRNAVELELGRRGFRGRVDDAKGIVFVEDGYFGLENLAQACLLEVESSWEAVIRSHFDAVLQGRLARESLSLDALDFDKMKSLLRVKLYDRTRAPPDFLVGRLVADDLFAALVYDLPTCVAPVLANEIREWGTPLDEVLQLGLSNVRNEGLLDVRLHQIGALRITELSGDSFFAATHMLFADQYVAPKSPCGLLVACPTRHFVFVHAIGNGSVSTVIHRMANAVHRGHEEGPGSITSSLYWWQSGNLERLAIEREQDNVTLTPSVAFADMLSEHASGGGGSA